jgi:hypothetical protein
MSAVKLACGERFLSLGCSNDKLHDENGGDGHSTRVHGKTSLDIRWLAKQQRRETDVDRRCENH